MLLDIVGGSYKAKYISVNAQRTINFYIHKTLIEDQKDKYLSALYPFPGLSSLTDTSRIAARGNYVAKTLTTERAFSVYDNILYEFTTDGTLTNRGTLTNMGIAGTVFMRVNANNELMIADNTAGYILNLDTNTLTQITDVDYPGGVTYLDYVSGYFLIVSGGRVYYSDLNNGTSWNASSVFTPAAEADNTLAAVVWRDDIHCFGANTIELYINDGVSPFIKQSRSTIFIGLVSVDTIQVFPEGIFFLGKTISGQSSVYFYDGQNCIPISNMIEWQWNNPSILNGVTWDNLTTYTWDQWFELWNADISTSYADQQYSKDGHRFYYLTVPFTNTTYVYDLLTKEWIERQSLNPTTTSTQSTFRGKYQINFQGLNLWSDIYTGKILKEDYTIATENSSTITRTRISNVFSEEDKFISIYSLQITCNSGVGLISDSSTSPNISLEISKDGGNTYGSAKNLPVGASPNYKTRVKKNKVGTARNWVFRFKVTDAADVTIQNAVVHGLVASY